MISVRLGKPDGASAPFLLTLPADWRAGRALGVVEEALQRVGLGVAFKSQLALWKSDAIHVIIRLDIFPDGDKAPRANAAPIAVVASYFCATCQEQGCRGGVKGLQSKRNVARTCAAMTAAQRADVDLSDLRRRLQLHGPCAHLLTLDDASSTDGAAPPAASRAAGAAGLQDGAPGALPAAVRARRDEAAYALAPADAAAASVAPMASAEEPAHTRATAAASAARAAAAASGDVASPCSARALAEFCLLKGAAAAAVGTTWGGGRWEMALARGRGGKNSAG
jgi:hypothetical protein